MARSLRRMPALSQAPSLLSQHLAVSVVATKGIHTARFSVTYRTFSVKVPPTVTSKSEQTPPDEVKATPQEQRTTNPTSVTTKDGNSFKQVAVAPERGLTKVAIKDAASHYWDGTKLLAKEALLRLACPDPCQANDRRPSAQSTMFIIIPFMEVLLPVALKLFPGLLPSTYQTKLKKEEKRKKALQAKIEMARFLQQTAKDMALDVSHRRREFNPKVEQRVAKFHDFIVKAGAQISNEDLMQFSKLFKDDITLDNIQRPQLVSMCKLLNLPSFGSNNMLRYQLHSHIRKVKKDDALIVEEGGAEGLSLSELREACDARGMRNHGMILVQYQAALNQWLDLSLNKKVPMSLLIMSRAFVLDAPLTEALAQTISAMPDEVVKDVEFHVGKQGSVAIEHVETQAKLIEEEWEDEKRMNEEAKLALAAEKAAELEVERAEQAAAEAAAEAATSVEEAAEAHLALTEAAEDVEEMEEAVAEEGEVLDVEDIAEALSELTLESAVQTERDALASLQAEAAAPTPCEEQSTERLQARVSSMLRGLAAELNKADAELGSSLRLLDLDRDGIISTEELDEALVSMLNIRLDKMQVAKLVEALDPDGDGQIQLGELQQLVEKSRREREEELNVDEEAIITERDTEQLDTEVEVEVEGETDSTGPQGQATELGETGAETSLSQADVGESSGGMASGAAGQTGCGGDAVAGAQAKTEGETAEMKEDWQDAEEDEQTEALGKWAEERGGHVDAQELTSQAESKDKDKKRSKQSDSGATNQV